jgi:hypothetical protein
LVKKKKEIRHISWSVILSVSVFVDDMFPLLSYSDINVPFISSQAPVTTSFEVTNAAGLAVISIRLCTKSIPHANSCRPLHSNNSC